MKQKGSRLIIGAGIVAIFLWRWLTPQSAAHVAIVSDRSFSPSRQCDCIETLGERSFAAANRGGSKRALFITGDASTGREPLLLEEFKIPKANAVIEGAKAVASEREKILESLKSRCKTAKLTDESPIFLAIKRATEHLARNGCKPGSDCALFVQTDGEEMSDMQIRRALDQSQATKIALTPRIHNDGVKVIFVGLAQINGSAQTNRKRVKTDRLERIKEVWRSLFSNPDDVSFEPFCTNDSASASR